MQEVQDLRQLTVGNIVLMVGFDHANFSVDEPLGWHALPCVVTCTMSSYFQQDFPSIELLPVRAMQCKDEGPSSETFFIYQDDTQHPADPTTGPLFTNDFGMGGVGSVKLFLLTHTQEFTLSLIHI